jgi:hypothetical protein
MFLEDVRVTIATLSLVAIVAGLFVAVRASLIAGGVLIIDCLAIIAEAACREARQWNRHE